MSTISGARHMILVSVIDAIVYWTREYRARRGYNGIVYWTREYRSRTKPWRKQNIAVHKTGESLWTEQSSAWGIYGEGVPSLHCPKHGVYMGRKTESVQQVHHTLSEQNIELQRATSWSIINKTNCTEIAFISTDIFDVERIIIF